MKLLILITAFPLIFEAQLNSLVKKFFLDLPIKSELFDIRASMQSNDNFYNINDSYSCLSANFTYHPNIPNIKKRLPRIVIQFGDDNKSNIKKMLLSYNSEETSECINRYNEIVSIFKPYMAKSENRTVVVGEDLKKVGTGVMMWPKSGASFYCIKIGYDYNENNSTYTLEVLLFEKSIWK
jgi:hypothetical protein